MAWLAACVSIFSFLFYLRSGEVLLYGDAVAHINIARRLFDSLTPGLLQLGTVWLPLPHLLMAPFLLSDWMWTTGAGGSIPSMAAYILGTLGIFRLVRGALATSQGDIKANVAAWGAAIIYGANPNLIYMQSTAMTEAVYLAFFIWAVVHFTEFAQQASDPEDQSRGDGSSSLSKCGWCLAAACLTRYDGWFLAAAMCVAGAWIVIRTRQTRPDPKPRKHKAKRPAVSPYRKLASFFLLAAAGPVLWLAYNAIVYRNALEFANGPYSAKAIELRTPGASHPGSHDLPVAFSYFLKSAEINLAAGYWQKLWILLALAGSLACLISGKLRERIPNADQAMARSRLWPLLLLWVPLPFYVLSVAYSGVPIFMPVWWPFSYYNVRYGLELLPAFAVFASLAFYFVATVARKLNVRIGLGLAALIFVVASYFSIWRDPVCVREALVNSRTRIALERELTGFVKAFPSNSTVLMYLGNHVGAVAAGGHSACGG